jgi:site-specific DNA recombinase
MENEVIRAVIYARVSSEQQAAEDKVSIRDQVADCRKHALENGFEVITEYIEPGLSGELFEERTAYQHLLDDATKNKFDLVLARFSSRVGRANWMLGFTRSQLKKSGVQLRVLNQTLQPIVPPSKFKGVRRRDPSQLFEDAFHGAMAEFEISNLVEKSLSGKRGAVEHGKPVQSKPPYGYQVELNQITAGGKAQRKFVPKYPEYNLVLEVPSLVLERHLSDQQIADLWNERGLRCNNGGLWRSNYIQRIRQNPFYIGQLVHGRYVSARTERGKMGVVKNYDTETMTISKHEFEKPWTVETFEAMQRLKESRNQRGKTISSKSPLSGLIKCGYCGGPMFYERPNRRNAYVDCLNFRKHLTPCQANRWPMVLVWQGVVQLLDDHFSRLQSEGSKPAPDEIKESSQLDHVQKELTQAQRKREKEIPERLTRINYAFETGITEAEIYRTQINQWKADKLANEQDIARLESLKEEGQKAIHHNDDQLAIAEMWHSVRDELNSITILEWPDHFTKQVRYEILYPIFAEIRVQGIQRERYERVKVKPKLEAIIR